MASVSKYRQGDQIRVPVYNIPGVRDWDSTAEMECSVTDIVIPVGVDLEAFKGRHDMWVANAAHYIQEHTPPEIDVEAIDWEIIRVMQKMEMKLGAVLDMGILGKLRMVCTMPGGWSPRPGVELRELADRCRLDMIDKLGNTYRRKRDELLWYAVGRMKQSDQAVYKSAH